MKKKGGGGVKRGDAVSCPQVPVMMLTQKSNKKKMFENRLAFYFHRQSDENRIMKTVKEI